MSSSPSTPEAAIHVNNVAVVLAWRSGKKLKLGRIGKQKALESQIIATVQSAETQLQLRERMPWSVEGADETETVLAAKPDIAVGYPVATWESAPENLGILQAFEHVDDIPLVDPRELASIFLYAFVVTDDTGTNVYIRKSNPKRYLESTKWYVDFTTDVLKIVKGDLMAFDDRFDFILRKDEFLILDRRAFEFVFRDTEAIRIQVPILVKDLANVLTLSHGSDQQLKDISTKQVRSRRRLEAILERGHLGSVTPEHLRDRLASRGADRLAECMDDNNALIFTAKNTSFLLKFLNEDLFNGELSNIEFEAARKTPSA